MIIIFKVHYQFLSAILKYALNNPTDSLNNELIQAIATVHNYPLGRITHQPLWEWAVNTVTLYNKIDDNTRSTIAIKDNEPETVTAELSKHDNSKYCLLNDFQFKVFL